MTSIQINIEEKLEEQLNRYCNQKHVQKDDFIRRLLANHLEKEFSPSQLNQTSFKGLNDILPEEER